MKPISKPGKGHLQSFLKHLQEQEKSTNTIEKYQRDCQKFLAFCQGKILTKELVMNYKERLKAEYRTASVNSMLAAVNHFLRYLRREDCRVQPIKVQRRIFCDEKEELTKQEYQKLLQTAKKEGKRQLYLMLQTICGTGIRVSELAHITVEAVKRGRAVVECKNKQRVISIPEKLKVMLLQFIQEKAVKRGAVFTDETGAPINRTKIWRLMKRLSLAAGVDASKVFPHNLRHLFARTFYAAQHDIARLADLLGHSSIETTRIYMLTTFRECFDQVSRLGLIS